MAQHVITDGQARRIASEWHGGSSTALYSLASCGHINLHDVRAEISAEIVRLDVGKVRRDLLALDKYVTARLDRRIVKGWPSLWDETPVTVDQC